MSRPSPLAVGVIVVAFAIAFLWAFQGARAQTASSPHTTWSDYGGGADSAQYSALTQINRSNVSTLQIAWTYPTGDGGNYLFNPVVVDGVMYVLGKSNSIVALDAATGKEIWIHENGRGRATTRGINYWESKDRSERRLLFSHNQFLQAIDARTGQSILSFGVNGRVDLREGLDRDPSKINVQSATPGRVFENLIILGSATNQEYDSAPGDVRAYDVRTGALVWTFHTVPRPGEFGYDTWPADAWKTVGGANAWSELSVDEKRAIVYVPTGSPKYNFYGANRPGANLFGDCLLALDARTGKRIWHFQMVHHDIWDYDNPTAPKLLTVRHDGKMVDVVAQAGKTGFLYVFNRETGESLWPIEERPVPRSDMPGEETWPTQPFPVAPPPFARQSFTEKDLSPFIEDPAERARFLDDIRNARNEGLFTPPGIRNTIQMPGNNGGSNFSGAAVDPQHGTMFIVSKDFPSMLKLELGGPSARTRTSGDEDTPSPPAAPTPSDPRSADPRSARYRSSFGFMITTSGLSAIAPPWTTLTAYDLNTGTIKWKIPLGEVPELAAKGFTDTGGHFPKVGPVVTAGGLIFTGTRDRQIRALDADTGKMLWKAEVEAGVEGIPAVYELNGRQYVVYCAAARATTHTHAIPGHPASNTAIPGAYVAFALPMMKLSDVLVFGVPTVKAEADSKAFEAHVLDEVAPAMKKSTPGWELHLVRKDRGNHPGRHLVALLRPTPPGLAPFVETGGPSLRYHEYHLVGADKVGPLPEVDVLGIHYIKVRPERRDAFDRFVIEKLHPAVGNLRPDLRLLYYKSVRGEDAGSYITIFALTKESRDKYWPKGADSEDLKIAFKPVQALTEELKTYLVEGSYATGNLAAAVYESREWADWVRVPASAR